MFPQGPERDFDVANIYSNARRHYNSSGTGSIKRNCVWSRCEFLLHYFDMNKRFAVAFTNVVLVAANVAVDVHITSINYILQSDF